MSLLYLISFNFQAPDVLDFTVKYFQLCLARADDNSPSSVVD